MPVIRIYAVEGGKPNQAFVELAARDFGTRQRVRAQVLAVIHRLKTQTKQQTEAESARAFFDVMLVYSGGANDRVESGATWRKSARVAQALLYLGSIALGPVPFLVSSRHACILDQNRKAAGQPPRCPDRQTRPVALAVSAKCAAVPVPLLPRCEEWCCC